MPRFPLRISFRFKGRRECDFVLQEGTRPTECRQVCWEVTPRNERRELEGWVEAAGELRLHKGGILTYDQEGTRKVHGRTVRFLPVWKWLLTSEGE